VETKAKIRAANLNRSEEVLTKLREHLNILNASQKHKDHLAKLNASLEHISKTAKSLSVINIDNGESSEFRSIRDAAKFYKVSPETIRRYEKSHKLLLGKYQITYKS
jgi:hypothetical protein